MNRVATGPIQYNMMTAMAKTQQKLADALNQQNTGKKADDYADLGVDTTRTLAARSMLERQQAQNSVGSQVKSVLEYYDTGMSTLDDGMSKLKTTILEAVGSGNGDGLQQIIEDSFQDLRSTLNQQVAGQPIYAGAQTGKPPFAPEKLSDIVGMDPADAFTNDNIRTSAQISDNVTTEYGIGADEVGTNLFKAFQTLAAAGPFGAELTDAQVDALKSAMGEFDVGIADVRAINANNGRRQNQVETLMVRGEDREIMLQKVIKDAEDADLAEVQVDIVSSQTLLQASYSTFARLQQMSLVNYL